MLFLSMRLIQSWLLLFILTYIESYIMKILDQNSAVSIHRFINSSSVSLCVHFIIWFSSLSMHLIQWVILLSNHKISDEI